MAAQMHRYLNALERALQVAGGAALLYRGLTSSSPVPRWLLTALGGGLLFAGVRGEAGHALARLRGGRRGRVLHLTRTLTIDRPADELYAFWRNFANLPHIMRHLESVEVLDSRRSRWRARGPLGAAMEWDAELTHEIPGRELGWRSLPGADVENSGIVRFLPSPLGHGTQLHVEMQYAPPAGRAGAAVARLLGEEPQLQIDDDLQRFKHMVEQAAAGGRPPPLGPGEAGAYVR